MTYIINWNTDCAYGKPDWESAFRFRQSLRRFQQKRIQETKKNHIDCLDGAILVDRQTGDCYTLIHDTDETFTAIHTTQKYQFPATLKNITSGLVSRRYRVLEVKN